jgi:DNA-binding CsgD family transcriptional regulator
LPELWAALHDLAGLQAWLEGDTATAVAELERAVSAWDDVALTRFAVRSAITAALVAQRLGRRDGASRRAAAVELARRGQHAAVLQRIGEARVEGLTAREEAVMLLVAEGRTSGDVAAELDISAATVESHVRSACRKLGAPSRREAALQVSQRA